MGHSVIDYHGRAEIFTDMRAHLCPCFIVETVNCDASSLTSSVQALLQYWSKPEIYWIPGGIDLRLDEYLKTPADCECLTGLITATITRIEAMGSTISADYLNQMIGPSATVEYGDQPAEKIKTSLLLLANLLKE